MERSPLCYAVLEYAHSLIGEREEKREKMREKEPALHSLRKSMLISRWLAIKVTIESALMRAETATSGATSRSAVSSQSIASLKGPHIYQKCPRFPARRSNCSFLWWVCDHCKAARKFRHPTSGDPSRGVAGSRIIPAHPKIARSYISVV